MKTARRERTEGKLLEAACKVFAEKGFRDATIAEICRAAGVNIAAVNYYFGNKEKLYIESWRLALRRSLRNHPPDGGVPPTASPERRLHGRILPLMRRIFDRDSHEFDIIHKEMATPTGLLAEVVHESIEPIRRGMRDIVRELLGEGASERQVLLCQRSITAQCFDFIIHHRRRVDTLGRHGQSFLPVGEADVDALADHVTRFSLAGMSEVRRGIQSRESAKLR